MKHAVCDVMLLVVVMHKKKIFHTLLYTYVVVYDHDLGSLHSIPILSKSIHLSFVGPDLIGPCVVYRKYRSSDSDEDEKSERGSRKYKWVELKCEKVMFPSLNFINSNSAMLKSSRIINENESGEMRLTEMLDMW